LLLDLSPSRIPVPAHRRGLPLTGRVRAAIIFARRQRAFLFAPELSPSPRSCAAARSCPVKGDGGQLLAGGFVLLLAVTPPCFSPRRSGGLGGIKFPAPPSIKIPRAVRAPLTPPAALRVGRESAAPRTAGGAGGTGRGAAGPAPHLTVVDRKRGGAGRGPEGGGQRPGMRPIGRASGRAARGLPIRIALMCP
jgi:hypothetical protein